MRSGQQIWDVVPSPGKKKGSLSSMATFPTRNSRQPELAARPVGFRSASLRMQQKLVANGKERWQKEIVSHLEAKFLEV
jgi:hypothetical protein